LSAIFLVTLGTAAEWFEQSPMTSRDPFVLAIYLYDNILQTHYDVRFGANSPPGYVYLQLPTADFNSVYGRPGHRMVRLTKTPTASQLAFIQTMLQRRTAATVPYFLQALSAIPPTPPTVGLTFTLLDFLSNQPNSPKTSAANILPLLASGGQFDEVVVAGKDSAGHTFWSTSAVYRVQVGNETRNSVFTSATYAARLVP
jgi:hypothetical protein